MFSLFALVLLPKSFALSKLGCKLFVVFSVLILYCFNGVNYLWNLDDRLYLSRTLLVRINFSAVPLFDVLNEKWKITESKADRLALEIDTDCTEDLKILVLKKRIFFCFTYNSFD
jgi:hypothetical protein